MMYWSARGWEAVLFGLRAGVWGGLLMTATTLLRRRAPRWLGNLADTLCGLALAALFGWACWLGTEGILRPFMAAAEAAGAALFCLGPGAWARRGGL